MKEDNHISMTVEEARSVYWLRNNHRPLGELLDEGYLNRGRLQWAAERAYDPQLKAAAAVLLEHLQREATAPSTPPTPAAPPPAPAIAVTMTVEQARATPWPFRPFRGQLMGILMDTRQVSLKDLAYAVENAWDEQVRQAAIVLSALWLEQAVKEPPPPAGPLKVMSGGRSFAERRQLQLMMVEGLISGLLLGALITWGFMSFLRSQATRTGRPLGEALSTPEGLIALLIMLAVGAALGWLVTLPVKLVTARLDRKIESYRKGQEGEDRIVEVMRQNLDGDWTLFRNVVLPGRKRTDIDAVLVGPPGVWALEIKNLGGEYRNIGEHWEVRAGQRWKLLRKSPSLQAQNNAVRLAGFFRADKIRQWVTPVVVWANPESTLIVENPSVAIWTLDRLPEELGNIWRGKGLLESERTIMIDKLTALCQPKQEDD